MCIGYYRYNMIVILDITTLHKFIDFNNEKIIDEFNKEKFKTLKISSKIIVAYRQRHTKTGIFFSLE